MFGFSYFLGKDFFGDDGFQNMFVYQPIFNILKLKEDKDAEYVISWKSKGVYNSKIISSLYTSFLHNIKNSVYKMGMQFNNSILVVEKSNYATKIVNAHIVYDLDNSPRNPLNNFLLKIVCFM